jgi:transposase
VTHHSIVRSPRRVGSERDSERSSTDVMMTDAEKKAATEVILGVDTHLDVHVAVALDHLGRRLGELGVPTTAKGYESLVRWAEGFGTVRCAGVEGTSSYGAGITRYLRTAAIAVTEVDRPKRRHLHRSSKSDSRDAESAARAGNKPERRPGSPRALTAAWR